MKPYEWRHQRVTPSRASDVWPLAIVGAMPFVMGAGYLWLLTAVEVNWRAVGAVAAYGIGAALFVLWWMLPVLANRDGDRG